MAELNDAQSEVLLRLVADTAEVEIVCEAFRRDVAAYHARVTRGQQLSPQLAAVAQHRLTCPECDEEYEVLSALESAGEA